MFSLAHAALCLQLGCSTPAAAGEVSLQAAAAVSALAAAEAGVRQVERVVWVGATPLAARLPQDVAGRLTPITARETGDGIVCDTTIQVRPGSALELNALSGSIRVRGWGRNAVRVVGTLEPPQRLYTGWKQNTLLVRTRSPFGPALESAFQLQVPTWMALRLSGFATDIHVSGTRAPITASTMRGDVAVEDGADLLDLESVEGSVIVRGARGRIRAGSVNSLVRLERIAGAIEAQSINGDIEISQLEVGDVGASSLNGRVMFVGPFRRTGHYALSSHNGEVIVGVPENAGVTLTLTSFNGDVHSDVPFTSGPFRRGHRYSLALGGGGAALDLEAFHGAIRLLRPQEVLDQFGADRDDENEDPHR